MRTWFTLENTHGLSSLDLQIMNRAARIVAGKGPGLSHETLAFIRQSYRTGMSAVDLSEMTLDQRYGR